MAFLHKLAQRLARLRTALIIAAVATIACEIPMRQSDPSGDVALLQLSPKTLTLRIDQTAQFVAVGLTSNGDTAQVSVTWSATGGSIVDTSTSGGRHYIQYEAPSQPGQYRVIINIQSPTGGPSTQAGLSAPSAAVELSDSAIVNVTAVPVASVSISPAVASATVGQTVQLTATTLDSSGASLSGRTVTWASSNSTIATVSASGLVTGVAAGSATITATSEGKSGTAAVTVTLAPVASVGVSPSAVGATVGDQAQFTATLQDANGNVLTGRVVTWVSSNPSVATVSNSGLVTAVTTGLAIITATSEGRNGTAGITVTATPAVVASVSVSPATANVTAGQTVQLTATPQDASGNVLLGRVVTWASSNTGLATVSGSGLVTGVATGAATITATIEGQNGSSVVTVTVPVASVSVSPASASVTTGQTVQLTATPRDASGNALTGRVITWGSSNTAVATVNGSGLVTGVAVGSATITATSEGRSGTSTISVTRVPVASVSVSPASASVTTGQTVQLTATPRDASGNALTGRVVTWSSSNTTTATVSTSGLVRGVAAGTVTITATSEGQNGTSAITVTVAPVATVSVSPASTSVVAGGTVQLAVTLRDANGNVLSGRVVTWSSNATSVATVNVSGLVTALVVGTATITATSEGQSGTSALTVMAAPPPGTWPNEPAGFTLITDNAMNDVLAHQQGVSLSDGWFINNAMSGSADRVTDTTARLSAPNVMQLTYPAGFGDGTEPANMYRAVGNVRDLYIGFWWKVSNPWQRHPTADKIVFQFLGGGGSGGQVFLAMWNSGVLQFTTELSTENRNYSPNINATQVSFGVWHRVELRLRQSPSLVQWWLDGVLQGSYTTVPWPAHDFDEFQIAPTWGGNVGAVKTETDYYRFDHIHISRP